MRHRKNYKKLGRSASHRKAMLAALVCGLIKEKRITTTVTKAKLCRTLAERMVTAARGGTLAARRRILGDLHREDCVAELFSDVAPKFQDRPGGYTRVTKMGRRSGDSSEMAIVEWVGIEAPERRKKAKPAAGNSEK